MKNRSQISIPFTEIVRIKNMCQSTLSPFEQEKFDKNLIKKEL